MLPPFRKNIFLTTKSPQRTRQGAEKDLEESLRTLRTDHVDLWQIHQVGSMEEVEQIFAPGGAIEAFEAAKIAGKCRFIGFTGHHDPRVHLAMFIRAPRAVQRKTGWENNLYGATGKIKALACSPPYKTVLVAFTNCAF